MLASRPLAAKGQTDRRNTILVTTENVKDVEAQLQDTVFPAEGGAATPTA